MIRQLGQRQIDMDATANQMGVSMSKEWGNPKDIQQRRDTMMQLREEAIAAIHPRIIASMRGSRSGPDRNDATPDYSSSHSDGALLIGQINRMFREQNGRVGNHESNTENLEDSLRIPMGGGGRRRIVWRIPMLMETHRRYIR